MYTFSEKGLFLVFEGCDGCGKSNQLNRSRNWLLSMDFKVLVTKEPNKDGYWGKKIYADLADKTPNSMHNKNPFEFQRWYALDSAENMASVVIPALNDGIVVLKDRYRPSLVYGVKTEKEIEKFLIMNFAVLGRDFIWPHVIFIFDVEPEIAMNRLNKKGITLDEFESRKEFIAHVVVCKNNILLLRKQLSCFAQY